LPSPGPPRKTNAGVSVRARHRALRAG
jgi:hypothetical protein